MMKDIQNSIDIIHLIMLITMKIQEEIKENRKLKKNKLINNTTTEMKIYLSSVII